MSTSLAPELLELLEMARKRKGITAKSVQKIGQPFNVACDKLSTLRVSGMIEFSGQKRAGHSLYKLTEAGEKALVGAEMII